MARTRAQEKAAASKSEDKASSPATKSKVPKKRREPEEDPDSKTPEAHRKDTGEPPAKASKPDKKAKQTSKGHSRSQTKASAGSNDKIQKLLSTYGSLPLKDTALQDPSSPTPETVLAHLLNATLSSTRISHQLAAKTVRTVVEAGYANLETLEKSTWQQRTEVLTEGGYTHYREKTATQLGELAELIRSEYDGDLNNLLAQTKEAAGSDNSKVRDEVRNRMKKIKGVGNVAVDVFCDTAQSFWHELAPFLDPRSQKTGAELGLPTNIEELFEAVGRDPVEMCKLASALTVVRLEGKERGFA